jgi:hypothetical protein
MKQHEEKKSSEDDSLDLDARARATFAATAEDIGEEGNETYQEGISEEGWKSYLEDVIDEVKKEKTSTKARNTEN